MSDETPAQGASTACPICGSPAEVGYLSYPHGGWTWLRWRDEAPSVWGTRPGEPVGDWGLLRGPYAKGIRCERCHRIVLDY